MRKQLIAFLAGGLLLAACGPNAQAVKQIATGDQLAFYEFSSPRTFEEGTYNNGTAQLEIRDGAYHIDVTEGDGVLWYGQWGDTLSDVVIDVETNQTSEDKNSLYGVGCRVRGTIGQTPKASDTQLSAVAAEPTGSNEVLAQPDSTAEPTSEATAEATREAVPEATEASQNSSSSDLNINNGDGYLFLIESSGRFAIMRSRSGNVTALVNWTGSGAIKSGIGQNRIRAVCMGSYLAMYVNGQFMADTSDDTYTQGQVSLIGATTARAGLRVEFDNLTVYEAKSQ